jgi:hypothetical protein
MVRIMTATEPLITTVTVDGRVGGEYVQAIDTCVRQAIARGRPVHLFLRDVSSIDEGGQRLLARLAANGVQLSANGVYTSYIVAEISRSAAAGNWRPEYRDAIAEIPALRRQTPAGGRRKLTECSTSDGDRDALGYCGERIRKCG